MDKREACRRLAEINEEIYDLTISLEKIESKLCWDGDGKRDWYLEKKDELLEKFKKCKEEHDEFLAEYGDIIHS